MAVSNGILIGKGEQQVFLDPRFANRHGLIAGATGTGKTISLQILAEGLSRLGVPVFLADIKGDLTGLALAGTDNPKITERVASIGVDNFHFEGYPSVLWDLLGEQGHPVRATISDMGPLLLSRLLELNDTQEGVLNLAFKFADDEGLLLLDLKDLRALLQAIAEQARELQTVYGNISASTVGAIQRRLLVLEQEGGDKFFGEPSLDLNNFIRTDVQGRGQINILAADKLINSPRLYATFLLWMLSELFEQLPEVGDVEKPRLVFFFDEAHLLFTDAPKALLTKIEQVVKLIRSKGVGIYFITQTPLDIPDSVLGQLGNRIQHALRAFTPRDQKAVRAAAETFRANPAFDTETVITEMGVGEALVSVLEQQGTPSIVQRTKIRPPQSRIGPLNSAERAALIRQSPFAGRYDVTIDRESAYERLTQRAQQMAAQANALEQAKEQEKLARRLEASTPRASTRQSPVEAFITSTARTVGTKLGKEIVRGLFGTLFGGRR